MLEPNNWLNVRIFNNVLIGDIIKLLKYHDQQHCYHHAPTVEPEAATAVVELLMMGVRTPEKVLSCK